MAESIAKFHGAIRPCSCGAYSKETGKVDPEKSGQRSCALCFGRGFLASCLRCEGKGQYSEGMAGGPGSMTVTCSSCGGTGFYGVNKPADWVDEPVEVKEEVPA
jgi:hypothetical protein